MTRRAVIRSQNSRSICLPGMCPERFPDLHKAIHPASDSYASRQRTVSLNSMILTLSFRNGCPVQSRAVIQFLPGGRLPSSSVSSVELRTHHTDYGGIFRMAGPFCSVSAERSLASDSIVVVTNDSRDIKASGRNEEQRIFWEFSRKRSPLIRFVCLTPSGAVWRDQMPVLRWL